MIFRRLAALVGILVLGAGAVEAKDDRPGAFDFYVLALSWSPTYCLGERASPAQCRTATPRGFVVHGLWPQFERGFPDFCQSPAPYVPEDVIAGITDLMPSKGLVLHEWRRHGTCSGLSPAAYFGAVRNAAARVQIPEALRAPAATLHMTPADVETAFRAINPGLEADMIAVSCADGRLKEVRVCMTRDFAFSSCPEVDRRACGGGRSLDVPPPRPLP